MAARELYPNRKIMAIFQPHLYSRTNDFYTGFAQALDQLDQVILLDIYPARERPIKGVSSRLIYDKMQLKNKILVKKADVLSLLSSQSVEVCMTLGAGDIGAMVTAIKTQLLTAKKENN